VSSPGGKDRYLPARFEAEYAARLPNSELIELPDAGHWPWIDAPAIINRVVRFLVTDEEFRNR
jgi:pimeloyl-ACP methyl ester carboxylesterase